MAPDRIDQNVYEGKLSSPTSDFESQRAPARSDHGRKLTCRTD